MRWPSPNSNPLLAADRERVEQLEPPAGDPHRLGDVVVEEVGDGQQVQGDAVHDAVAGPFGELGDSSRRRRPWARRSEHRRHTRAPPRAERRAVREGSGFGDEHVGFRSSSGGVAMIPGARLMYIAIVARSRAAPARSPSRHGGVGRHPEQPQGVVADEAAGGRAGGQPQVGHPLGQRWWRGRRPARTVAAPAPVDPAGTAARQARRPAPPPAPVASRRRRTTRARRRRRRRPGRTGRTRRRRSRPVRSGEARRRPAGTTARGRPGSGPAHRPGPAARRRTGGSSPALGTWSVRRARRRAGCARRGGPTRRRSPPARGRSPRRRGPRRRRTTTRTRRRRAAARDHRPTSRS